MVYTSNRDGGGSVPSGHLAHPPPEGRLRRTGIFTCPYGFIGKEVDVRVTDSAIEIFYQQNRVASHKRLRGRKGQYSTIPDHMPEKHQHYQEWNGDRFRQWARKIGTNTYKVIEAILTSKAVEEQAYLTCNRSLSWPTPTHRQGWKKHAVKPASFLKARATRESKTS